MVFLARPLEFAFPSFLLFVPHVVRKTSSRTASSRQDPVGFWDPVGFTSDGDVATFKRRRSVELKHGRISMMATMGHVDAT